MVNTLVQFRVDESDRTEAIEICSKLGIDLQSYFRICLARLSKIAKEYGISDLSLDEINEAIREARG